MQAEKIHRIHAVFVQVVTVHTGITGPSQVLEGIPDLQVEMDIGPEVRLMQFLFGEDTAQQGVLVHGVTLPDADIFDMDIERIESPAAREIMADDDRFIGEAPGDQNDAARGDGIDGFFVAAAEIRARVKVPRDITASEISVFSDDPASERPKIFPVGFHERGEDPDAGGIGRGTFGGGLGDTGGAGFRLGRGCGRAVGVRIGILGRVGRE